MWHRILSTLFILLIASTSMAQSPPSEVFYCPNSVTCANNQCTPETTGNTYWKPQVQTLIGDGQYKFLQAVAVTTTSDPNQQNSTQCVYGTSNAAVILESDKPGIVAVVSGSDHQWKPYTDGIFQCISPGNPNTCPLKLGN